MYSTILQRLQADRFETGLSGLASPVSTAGWHLFDTKGSSVGIDAVSVWADYIGRGVSVGVFDDGIATATSAATYGKHGTAVSGIIAGSPTTGATGIAYGATVTDKLVIGVSLAALTNQMAQQANFDIANHSWGWAKPFYADAGGANFALFFSTIETAASVGRDGLGTLINIAAGNFQSSGMDTNASNFSNDRHAVVVAAVTSDGKLTQYSSQGSSVWIAAPSGGGSKGGILTTDIAGSAGYSNGGTTSTFSGTSAATPQLSGVEALMLEANAGLGWRDAKLILAYSAQQPQSIAAVENGGSHWNGGGSYFSNATGFGVVDARAAVRLAETWLDTSTSANEAVVSGQYSGRTSLVDVGASEFKITLDAGVDIETVTIDFDGWHGRVSDLTIQVISPAGTVSTILSGKNGDSALNDWRMTSNAFLGEDSAGTWTVRISDAKTGMPGLVDSLTLKAFGSAQTDDDTFIFTDAFGDLGASALAISDGAGFDGINAAAVTSGSVIDLSGSQASFIDGRAVVIGTSTVIENAFGGDGNDRIIGNDANNLIWGGRGDDVLLGGGGNDILLAGSGNNLIEGGAGNDAARLNGRFDEWNVSKDAAKMLITSASMGTKNAIESVERFIFDDYTLAFDVDGATGQSYRIFEAALGRAPDLQGLGFWVSQIDSGMSLTQVAHGFTASNEFQSRYGQNQDDVSYVQALYANVQNRAADAGGLAFWVDRLHSGASDRLNVLIQFSESAENVAHTANAFETGVLLESAYLL
jgi:subtilisin-like proprotein convertase family protein